MENFLKNQNNVIIDETWTEKSDDEKLNSLNNFAENMVSMTKMMSDSQDLAMEPQNITVLDRGRHRAGPPGLEIFETGFSEPGDFLGKVCGVFPQVFLLIYISEYRSHKIRDAVRRPEIFKIKPRARNSGPGKRGPVPTLGFRYGDELSNDSSKRRRASEKC